MRLTKQLPTKIMTPLYYEKFSCIGGQCESNCCGGWRITIDKNTYMKYRKVKDAYLSPKISTYIKRTKDSSPKHYAQFLLKEDGQCPFQTEDGLCEIHAKLGDKYLCETCKIYPRHYSMVIDDYLEASLNMSCPEVIRLAVLDPKPITFVVNPKQFVSTSSELKSVTIPQTQGEFGMPAYLIWDIREACIDMMQNRELSLPERIFALGVLLRKATALKEENKQQEIPGISKMYVKAAREGEFRGKLNEFAFDETVNIAIKQTALKMIVGHAVVKSHNHEAFRQLVYTYRQCMGGGNDFALTLFKAENLVEFHHFIEDRAKSMWDDFLEEKGYILENYFVNLIFHEIFPFSNQTEMNIYQHFVMIAHQYAQIKMILCGSTAKGDQISERLIIDTLLAMSMAGQHNKELITLCKQYQAAGSDSLAHISYLLN